MEYSFFYFSTAAVILVFIICIFIRRFKVAHLIIGITSIAYSLSFEILLGDRLGLYYYIAPQVSTLYILLSGIFLYPLLNIAYTLFLPRGVKKVLLYTSAWIAAMLAFEYASIYAGTVVLTGWKMFPWSIITYIVTYIWIYLFYRFMQRNCFSVKL